MPPVLRPRKRQKQPKSREFQNPSTTLYHKTDYKDAAAPDEEGNEPPVYTIDLSQPPSQRYQHVAADFQPTIAELVQLFDTVCEAVRSRFVPIWIFHFLAWLFLRRLYSTEQTEELRGLSRAFGVPMYLLVAYNVLLDILMGCTSGGVLVQDRGLQRPCMMHFRTLDWGMSALRKATVQLRFVESAGGATIATTVGYVGFVGVLTGVRTGLSMSLNFRPYRNASGSRLIAAKYYWHLFQVLVGLRPSISAVLRDMLITPRTCTHGGQDNPAMHVSQLFIDSYWLESQIRQISSAATYLIFCTGEETMVVEKDLQTAKVSRSSTFIAATNHDQAQERLNGSALRRLSSAQHEQRFLGIGMQDLIEESVDRKQCLVNRWENHVRQQKRRNERIEARNKGAARDGSVEHGIRGVTLKDLRSWILEYPVCNEDTHFACIMDPDDGTVRWIRAFTEGEIEAPA